MLLAACLIFHDGVARPASSVSEASELRIVAGFADASTVRDVLDVSGMWHGWQAKSVSSRVAQICRWAGIIAVLLLAWIGFLHLTRGTAVRHVRGVGADGAPVGVSEPQFPLSIAMITGTPLTTGNRVEVALNGDGTYARLWEDLRSAKQSITLQLYYGNKGKVADTLQEILLDRAAAGVRVFVLYDAFGTLDMPRERVKSLRKSGIRVEPFRPLRSPPCTWRRTVPMPEGLSSTAESDGQADSASMTNGLAMAGEMAPGAKRMCVSKVLQSNSCKRPSRRRGRRRPACSSLGARL